MVFELEKYLDQLDELYEENPRELEAFMKAGLKKAEKVKDTAAKLTILNELMGYYRVTSQFEKCEDCVRKVKEYSEAMGIQGSLNYATVLLNIATAYRVMGKLELAEEYYQQVYECYRRELTGADYRMASFYNNRSLLYADMGRLQEAKQDLEQAMEVLQKLEQPEVEAAITHVNIGNICFAQRETEEGIRHMKAAEQIFEGENGRKDAHYASVLSGLGEAYFRMDQLEMSIEYYQKALEEIKKNYKENNDYEVTRRNLNLVKDIFIRREAVRCGKIKGLELSRRFYEEYIRPMLYKRYPLYAPRIAAGLAGEGSECQGYDDEFSTDHDYGPGCCLWLTKKDYDEIGDQLQKDYEGLAGEFMGFPARNETSQGKGRVGVLCMDEFFRRYTGYAVPPEGARQMKEWNNIDSTALGTVTNGEVFEDHLGEFTKRREGFRNYPEEVRRFKIASMLGKMAQTGQYNYGRMRRRRDGGAAWLCLSEFVDAAIEAAYLLNSKYMPIYKWKMRGMEEFSCLRELKPMLMDIMEVMQGCVEPVSGETLNTGMESRIERICSLFVRELNRQGLSKSKENFLEVQKAEMLREIKPAVSFREMVDQVIELEWNQFQRVKNEGERASCQDDRETFIIMRKSQFLTWNEETLASYLEDLITAKKQEWNLMTEKYARMMESTAPERYEELKDRLPVRSETYRRLKECIVAKKVRWEEEFAKEYPGLAGRGRAIHTWEDTPWSTSVETYARGEVGTYSERTISLYRDMIEKMEQNQENHTKKVMEYMVRFYGYQSLEEAERSIWSVN